LLLDECLYDLYSVTGNQTMDIIITPIIIGITHKMSFIDNLFFFIVTKYKGFNWQYQYLPSK
jgi:hypothetical protein